MQEAIEHFKLKVTSIKPVEESNSSLVKVLVLASQEKLVLKIPFSYNKFLREKWALEILQDNLLVPRIIDWWHRDDTGPGVFLLSFIPGNPITEAISPELSFELGQLLGNLHTNQVENFGDEFQLAQEDTANWWAYIDNIFQSRRPICEEIVPQDLLKKTLKKYDELFANLPQPDGPCLVHLDYRPGNILVQANNIAGLIDFESARGGSADIDFTKIKNEVWDVFPNTKEEFLRGYATIRELPDLERTLPFYELYNAFMIVAWSGLRAKTESRYYHDHLTKLALLSN